MASLTKPIFAGIFGILYLTFGVTETLSGLVPSITDQTAAIMVPADIIGGLVLCVVAAVYLAALYRFETGTGSGQAYLYVAMALSVIFGTVALLSRGAQGADLILFGDEEPWSPIALFVPMVWLAILPATGIVVWKGRFSGNLVGE